MTLPPTITLHPHPSPATAPDNRNPKHARSQTTHIRSLLPDPLLKPLTPQPLLFLRVRILLLARPARRRGPGQVALLAAAGAVSVFDVLHAGGGHERAERVERRRGLDGEEAYLVCRGGVGGLVCG